MKGWRASHDPFHCTCASEKAAYTRAALCLLLSVLTFCYAGPLHQDATTVLAAKRILPVYSVERDDRVISISFDASWGGDQTMRILDLLDEYNAKATFFLVGIWVDKYPELVKEIYDRGHEIGNHSSKHPHMTKISESRMRQELSDMAEKLEAITGESRRCSVHRMGTTTTRSSVSPAARGTRWYSGA